MRLRLSVMMALLYGVQGAFWPLLAVHLRDLGISGSDRGWIFATMAIASFAMPLGAGRLVDRFLAGEKLLALILLLASLILLVFAWGQVTTAWALFGLFLVFWLIAAPAFALANAIALRHLERPYEQFPGVRLWGTVGWMGVGWVVSLVMAGSGPARQGNGAYEAFWVSSALAMTLAAYSLTLPATPPLGGRGGSRLGFSEVATLARRPGMRVLLVTAFGVHLTMPYVYQVLPTYLQARGLPRPWISTVMTLGQWPEIVMLAVLPGLLARSGPKTTLAIGITAWVLRFGSLAIDPPVWIAVAGIPLHGVGIACFTIAGQMYTDGQAAREQRAAAQAVYMTLTTGLGSLFGSLLAGRAFAGVAADDPRVFLVPCVINGALLVYFCAGFRPSAEDLDRAGAPGAALPFREDAVRGSVGRIGNLVTEPADG